PILSDTFEMRSSNTDILARRRTSDGAQTTPILPLHLRNLQKLRTSFDPLDQQGTNTSSRPTTPSQSSPSIVMPPAVTRSNPSSDDEILLQRYDVLSQRHLLRSHYCRSEVWLLLFISSSV